jgi:Lrp/AsnC family transcriptional regulator, leucine-responsive regulatory protein
VLQFRDHGRDLRVVGIAVTGVELPAPPVDGGLRELLPILGPERRRVRRLEQTGVIRGYRALIDPAAVGRSLRVFAGVRLVRHPRAEVVAFERAVIRLPEVVHSYHVTGNYDYLLQVEVADLPAYEDFHANRLASLPGVAMVNSYVAMKTLSAATA